MSSIAPNLTRDAGAGAQFFDVHLAVKAAEPARLPEATSLVPGMPAEVYFSTGDRTVLSYLFSPLWIKFLVPYEIKVAADICHHSHP